MVHTFNLSTQEAEAGGSLSSSQSKFQDSQGLTTQGYPVLKNKQINKIKQQQKNIPLSTDLLPPPKKKKKKKKKCLVYPAFE
jgi:flagellar hook protein FlgE